MFCVIMRSVCIYPEQPEERWTISVVSSELVIWDDKWGRFLELCSSSSLSVLWRLAPWHIYADRGQGCIPHLPSRKASQAQKHWETLSLLQQFWFSLAWCNSVQPLCQLVLNSAEWLCTYCCCKEIWKKTWTLKPVPWQQQPSSMLFDRLQLYGLKNERQLRYICTSGNTTWLCLHSTTLLDMCAR